MTKTSLTAGRGVLASQHLFDAIEIGIIHGGGFEVPPENIQPASLDLRLGEVAYPLRCSFLAPETQTVAQKFKELEMGSLDLHREGAVLEMRRPYLIPLKERLSLPRGMRAKANPKSSTGRLDIFTRLIVNRAEAFDEVPLGYRGDLWLEISPRSFSVRVREGSKLNQIRFRNRNSQQMERWREFRRKK